MLQKTPPPSPTAAWREARDAAEKHLMAQPGKISFDRKHFAPYLDKFGSDQENKKLFLEFFQKRYQLIAKIKS